MAVPFIVFVVCTSAGVVASSRWLPDLARGKVGGLAFFVVCGLLGATLGIVGVSIYGIVRTMEGPGFGIERARFVAVQLGDMLWQAGIVSGLAMAVYLLAAGRRPD